MVVYLMLNKKVVPLHSAFHVEESLKKYLIIYV